MILCYYGNNSELKKKIISKHLFNRNINDKFNIHWSENYFTSNVYENDEFWVKIIGNIYNVSDFKFNNKILSQKYILDQITNSRDNFVKKLNGEFILIILNKFNNNLSIYRDQLGFIPLYYYNKGDDFFFSTHLKTLTNNIDIELEIEEKWLLNSIFKIYNNAFLTNYKNIYRLPPANCLEIKNNTLTFNKYWQVNNIDKSINLKDKKYYEEFKKHLIESVEKRINSKDVIGCELSGGLDSSAITCISAQLKKGEQKKMLAFSHTLSKDSHDKIFPYKDERNYSNQISKRYTNVDHTLLSLKDHSLLDLMRQIIIELGYIPLNNYVKYLIEPIKNGKPKNINTFLSGFGGDEIVSHHSFYHMRLLMRGFRIRELAKYYKSYITKYNFGKIEGFVKLFTISFFSPLIILYKSYLLKTYDFKIINKPYIPKNIKKLIYQSKKLDLGNTLNEHMIKNFSKQKVLSRIEASSEYSILHGISFVYPLLDIDLIQYYFSLPINIKLDYTISRNLFREAIKEYVPYEILIRDKKFGSTVPSVQYSFIKDFDKISKFILYCKNNLKVHYIDYDVLLNWQNNLIKRKNNIGKIKMPYFISVLNFLVFQDMFEKGELQ